MYNGVECAVLRVTIIIFLFLGNVVETGWCTRKREREREIAKHGERGTLLLCVMHRDSSNMHVVFLFFRDIVIEETRLV